LYANVNCFLFLICLSKERPVFGGKLIIGYPHNKNIDRLIFWCSTPLHKDKNHARHFSFLATMIFWGKIHASVWWLQHCNFTNSNNSCGNMAKLQLIDFSFTMKKKNDLCLRYHQNKGLCVLNMQRPCLTIIASWGTWAN
jgi:hypothetical protein